MRKILRQRGEEDRAPAALEGRRHRLGTAGAPQLPHRRAHAAGRVLLQGAAQVARRALQVGISGEHVDERAVELRGRKDELRRPLLRELGGQQVQVAAVQKAPAPGEKKDRVAGLQTPPGLFRAGEDGIVESGGVHHGQVAQAVERQPERQAVHGGGETPRLADIVVQKRFQPVGLLERDPAGPLREAFLQRGAEAAGAGGRLCAAWA